jgi:branched-chain amino acid transport system permease protein
MVGGLFLGLVEVHTNNLIGSELRDITSFLILLLVLLIRPAGLFGKSQLRRV